MRIIAPLALLTLIFVQSAAAADLVPYYVTDLGTLPGGNASYANAINNRGQVVGSSYVQNASNQNVPYPVLYNKGVVQSLGTLGGIGGGANAINDKGQIVGVSRLAGNSYHAFLYDNRTIQDLGTLPGATNSDATGINNSGEIVGYSTNADNGGSQAFLYSNGTMQDIGTLPGNSQAEAQGINNRGEIVGWSYNFVSSGGLGGTFGHAYLYKNGTMTDLGTPPGLNDSAAVAVNNRGEVIGYSWLEQLGGGNAPYESWIFENPKLVDLGALPGALQTIVGGINNQGNIVGSSYGPNSWRAIFFHRNGVSDLNKLIDPNSGWTLEFANGINDRGQIVGEGIHDGLFSAYLLTPR